MNPRVYSKSDALLPVEKPALHNLYHVAWGNSNGVVGRCVSIDEENKTVILRSPKTRIDWKNPVKWSDLRHTRKMQLLIESQKP